jgi:hypothetical protein
MKYLILIILLLSLISCRKDPMPNVTTCVLGRLAHGRCVDSQGKKSYKDFDELVGNIMLSPQDAKAFTRWCYKANAVEGAAIDWRISKLLEELGDE